MRALMEVLICQQSRHSVRRARARYERMNPVYRNVSTTDAPVYLNIGDGGNREVPQHIFGATRVDAFREAVFGHGTFIMNSTQ